MHKWVGRCMQRRQLCPLYSRGHGSALGPLVCLCSMDAHAYPVPLGTHAGAYAQPSYLPTFLCKQTQDNDTRGSRQCGMR